MITLRAVVGRVAHAPRHDVVGAAVGRAEDLVPGLGDHLHRHDAHVERHARDADAVVGELSDRARDVGAVAVEVHRVVVVPDEVARRDEARAAAQLRCRGKGHVHHAERRVDRTAGRRAGTRSASCSERSPILKATPVSSTATMTSGPEPCWMSQARSMSMRRKVPLIRVQRIVRLVHLVVQVPRLRILDVAARGQCGGGRLGIDTGTNRDDIEVRGRGAVGRCARHLRQRAVHGGAAIGAVLELHDHGIGKICERRGRGPIDRLGRAEATRGITGNVLWSEAPIDGRQPRLLHEAAHRACQRIRLPLNANPEHGGECHRATSDDESCSGDVQHE